MRERRCVCARMRVWAHTHARSCACVGEGARPLPLVHAVEPVRVRAHACAHARLRAHPLCREHRSAPGHTSVCATWPRPCGRLYVRHVGGREATPPPGFSDAATTHSTLAARGRVPKHSVACRVMAKLRVVRYRTPKAFFHRDRFGSRPIGFTTTWREPFLAWQQDKRPGARTSSGRADTYDSSKPRAIRPSCRLDTPAMICTHSATASRRKKV